MQLQVERMVATKQESTQMQQNFAEGEGLYVARVYCMYQEDTLWMRRERQINANQRNHVECADCLTEVEYHLTLASLLCHV